MGFDPASLPPKILAKLDSGVTIEPYSGCWLWTYGWDGADGYSRIMISGTRIGVHRLSYMRHRGEIPEDLTIDHLCRTPCCINPAHLEVVTQGENTRRGNAVENLKKFWAKATHCKSGKHIRERRNFYVIPSTGEQICKPCKLLSQARYRQRHHGV